MQSASSPASLDARAAAAWLGVKAQTLYAYASRGLVRRVGSGKRRRYLLEDLERLQARQRARAGHGPVAAAALSFGQPVLDTRITGIDERGPRYRGHSALELCASGTTFEAVAELLWTGELPAQVPVWNELAGLRGTPRVSSIVELSLAVPRLRDLELEAAPRSDVSELAFARRLIRSQVRLSLSERQRRASGRIAELLATGSASRAGDAAAALDTALVLIADHELNASSFVARIAASTDASLGACVSAALATLSGPRHGGACDRIEALLDESASLARASSVIERRVRRGEALPGFGHPLYPKGDPRAPLLLERAQQLARGGARRKQQRAALALSEVMTRQGLPPTVDFGLVVLSAALGLPRGSAGLLFALGRSAGWVAHVLEQRGEGAVLRPRARYLGA